MNADLINHFQAIEDLYNKALIKRDLENLSKLLVKDWTIKEDVLSLLNKATFFNSLHTYELIYLISQKKVTNVKLYNQMAIVTSRGNVSGIYQGEKFNKDQVTINSYRRFGEDWFMSSSKETEKFKDILEKVDFHNWLKIYQPKRILS